MYRVITAKVTFGNIHASDKNVEYVTTIKNFMPKSCPNEAKSSSKSSLISSDSTELNSEIPTCIVDEQVFKLPSGYRCTNYVVPSGFVEPQGRQHPSHYGQTVDEDDILLQLAIQQSLSTHSEEPQVTALEVLGERDGLTPDLREYNNRRVNLDGNNDDLMLQRALAASMGHDTNLLDYGATGYDDDALRQIIELSKREEEERMQRELDEDEQLKKILELSLIEK